MLIIFEISVLALLTKHIPHPCRSSDNDHVIRISCSGRQHREYLVSAPSSATPLSIHSSHTNHMKCDQKQAPIPEAIDTSLVSAAHKTVKSPEAANPKKTMAEIIHGSGLSAM